MWAGDYREVDIYLDMELSINDEVNNPFPTRYDGPPPVYHTLLASIGSIPSSPTVTSVVATDPSVYYPVSDHIGTSQLIFDDQGNIVWQADTLPFGSLDVIIDLLPDHFRFPGQLFDNETGLHYNWHRYYDPEIGRYISADPIGLAGGINLYAYVLNDPINAVDPWGLMDGATLGRLGTGLMFTPIIGARPVGAIILGGAVIAVGWEAYTHFAKGERRWGRRGGDDPFWDLSVDELKEIERTHPDSKVRQRAKKIRKMKEKKRRCPNN